MTRTREIINKIRKEFGLNEAYYDPEYDEEYFEPGEPHERSEEIYTTLHLPIEGHEALLQALREIGYTKENDYDAIFEENGKPIILIEDAFVEYDIGVDRYGQQEEITDISSVSVPRVIRVENDGKPYYRGDADQQVDITDKLLPDDFSDLMAQLVEEDRVELNGPDEEEELRQDYYASLGLKHGSNY